MSKHTKGPWRFYNIGTVQSIMAGPKHDEVVHWCGFDLSHFPKQAIANGQRIVDCVNALEGFADPSAAPDLLEAAKLAVVYIRDLRATPGLGSILDSLEQAIAKAEGTK